MQSARKTRTYCLRRIAVITFLAVFAAACAKTAKQEGDDVGRHQRNILDFSGNSVLANDLKHVETGDLDVSRVNGSDPASEGIGFVGILQNEPTTFSVSANEINRNLVELGQVGAGFGNPNEAVTIAFDNEPLGYVVKQLLGGMLSANYVTSEEFTGVVSFKTETPVPRSSIPSILRDILAHYGYVMKIINGVYHIGPVSKIVELERNAAAGAIGDFKTRVLKLKNGNVEEIAQAVAQILPAGATITPVLSNNTLVLRVNPSDEKAVVDLIQAIIGNSGENEFIAVIPLRESPPEVVANAVVGYFQNSGKTGTQIPLVIPMEEQQSLLVVAQSQQAMSNMRTLVRGLDKENQNATSLRIIPLKNLSAEETAGQLNAIFANSNDGPGYEPDIRAQDLLTASIPDDGHGPEAENASSISAPAIIRGKGRDDPDNGSGTAAQRAAKQRLSGRLNRLADTRRSSEEAVSIVPDVRNNALLVHSKFRQFKRIRDVVRTLDVPLAQVVIEATIVEVALNDRLKYGVQAFLSGEGVEIRSSRLPDPADTGEPGAVALFDVDSVDGTTATFVLEALQTVTELKVISSPYLTVLDGKAARLSVGDQIPFLVQQTNASETGTTTTTNQIEVRDVGVILQVTPSIRPDNSVLLNVQQEVSSAKSSGSGENLTPVISQRTINSDVVIESGKMALLGGLIQSRSEEVTTKVPLMSKMPIVGNLFKQTDAVKDRTELLVMITPRVVRRSHQLDELTRLLRSRSTGLHTSFSDGPDTAAEFRPEPKIGKPAKLPILNVLGNMEFY
ncbi:general secretion proteinD [Stappia aggregata IAM 12614]|uniref:General secretion proteinD n=1 Tax=Roseibium aggregatum (strain ATCC 25650 / DSM 13394 / JCM 20685 / NBRC 16684 / NCIMB 2208 / IAM 12614 / B1) TaxID=384765 RepID=A0P0N8_ROSAI|nr:secretin N-terminal domain-containing protein [Roseibium aggregatum]EAV41352.1 general secretion proteinD [Stappia aggregata IAM 12614] [Roseibium aggregatum IAM 12614]